MRHTTYGGPSNAIVFNLVAKRTSGTEGHPSDIERCKQRLHAASGSVVVFFTATPVTKGATAMQEAQAILKLVKGVPYAGAGDEGFVSCFAGQHSA